MEKKGRDSRARRDKERAIRGIIPFPEFDDAPPGLVPGPGASPMIGDDEEEDEGGGLGSGGAELRFQISYFPTSCAENVACNVTTHTRKSERESHIFSTPGGKGKKMTVERDGRGRW